MLWLRKGSVIKITGQTTFGHKMLIGSKARVLEADRSDKSALVEYVNPPAGTCLGFAQWVGARDFKHLLFQRG